VKTVLIANRGEIAVRIVRACQEAGFASAAAYSDADKDSLPVRLADKSVRIGPPLARKSYLNQAAVLEAARSVGADAVHPGYGFLSESADFARRCAEAGLVFIGPPPAAIAAAGDKAGARRTLSKLGIPVIPGSEGGVSGKTEALEIAENIGYPVILKAAAGGGGRGMRIAGDAEALSRLFSVAAGEAAAAFGAGDLYLEKYIPKPRHVEIQILADAFGNAVFLGERECSIQKRYQKLIEESPSPCVTADMRRRMGETALRTAAAIGYQNAGTMEFLVDAEGRFYFMEVNARLQVEHPVTEMVTGVDLVREQLNIAAGRPLSLRQEEIRFFGWALECRINANDPAEDFAPSPGEIESVRIPGGPGVRFDTYLEPGALVPPFYDSLIGKLIVWDAGRPAALARMRRALAELRIQGVATTIPFHKQILDNPDFIAGDIDTHFLDRL
jgi:acetyl-CoA carboxylase biotin carboxylase subunit